MKDKISKSGIEQLRKECLSEIESVTTSQEELEKIRIKYFGRKGKFKQMFEVLKEIPLNEKKIYGELLNSVVAELKLKLEGKLKELSVKKVKEKNELSILELTLPGMKFSIGRVHPLQKVYDEIIDVFLRLGFDIKYGPEIEFEDYNFTMLNIPYDHPARDMQDTLYLDLPVTKNGKLLLRTHTSPVQIRVLLSEKPPIKSIMPGRVYRHENLDATHLFNFHQVEGLVVDKGIRLSDLKGVLTYFVKSIFGQDIKCRFRQSYFPFTEPSLEMDICCLVCKGEGCGVCKNSGYVEVLGCGMVHPQVLYNVGLGYEEYTGFAFGLGVERIAMLKYRIDDIRLFYENDIRFINMF
ncbi:MAG: phenylalanine--tRNA ligase subunit alpha [Elusimicrobiota bacterium]|nr:phenylalanine--tRNA ligase subunit alpha [Elusimicrobiota bacterium]